MRRVLAWVRRHPFRATVSVLATAFVLLNIAAYRHAAAMTTFVDGAATTDRPERLGVLDRMGVLLSGVEVRRPQNDSTPADFGLAFSTHDVTTSDDVTVELWHVPHDDARGVVVLGHGYSAAKSSVLTNAAALHEMGWASILFDFRGSGGSSGDHTTLGFHECHDVAAAMSFARGWADGRPVVLFGTSMGAAAALRAIAVADVRPDALIVEVPFDRLLNTVRARFELMGVPSWPSAELLVFWGGVQRDLDGFDHDPVRYAESVTCPTLLLHGSEDQRVSVEQIESIHDAFATSQKSLHVFEGLGHEPYAVRRGDEWGGVLRPFLDEVAKGIEGTVRTQQGAPGPRRQDNR